MKKKSLLFYALISLCITAASAGENILSTFGESRDEKNLEQCLKNGLEKLGVNTSEKIPEENLSIINFILKYTYENNIHKMRGEEENQVYVKDSGEEAVFDAEGNLVTNAWNKGSYNYGNYDEPIQKFELDIWPWLIWGNAREDPTSFAERFYYYLMDLDNGIQEYIFLEDKASLDPVNHSDLNKMDEYVYQLFNYLLFNESFKFDLSEKNVKKYRKSANNYWKYLSQLLVLSGYEN